MRLTFLILYMLFYLGCAAPPTSDYYNYKWDKSFDHSIELVKNTVETCTQQAKSKNQAQASQMCFPLLSGKKLLGYLKKVSSNALGYTLDIQVGAFTITCAPSENLDIKIQKDPRDLKINHKYWLKGKFTAFNNYRGGEKLIYFQDCELQKALD